MTAKAEAGFGVCCRGADVRCRLACLPRMPDALIVVTAEAEISFRDATAERMFGAGWPACRGADVRCRLACLINLEKNCIIQNIKFLQEQ